MKLKGSNYFVLLCDCSGKGRKKMLICGVYATKKEAQEVNREVEECGAKHYIKKCSVEVTV